MAAHSAFALALLATLSALLAWGAVTDVRSRTIANGLTLAIAILALPWWWATGLSVSAMALQLGIGLVVFALFAGCFAIGMMGGGDVKLIAALALWLPLHALEDLLLWMALAGGVLTLAMMARRRLRADPAPIEVPYGVAIVLSAFLVLANDILTTAVA